MLEYRQKAHVSRYIYRMLDDCRKESFARLKYPLMPDLLPELIEFARQPD